MIYTPQGIPTSITLQQIFDPNNPNNVPRNSLVTFDISVEPSTAARTIRVYSDVSGAFDPDHTSDDPVIIEVQEQASVSWTTCNEAVTAVTVTVEGTTEGNEPTTAQAFITLNIV